MIEPSALLLISGALILASVVASRMSDRYGVPALIVFLTVGMLAGSEGPGGIYFDNAQVANFIGTLALAFILFSGGLDTNWRAIRPVLWRGIILSTAGVVITALLVGLFAWAALGLGLAMGLLVGSIVSSTDAAAVFSILRRRGVSLRGNLKPLLEFESGSNDPTAVFLTIGMTRIVTDPTFQWFTLIPAFVMNMLGGIVVGLVAGKLVALLFNRMRLNYEGLYPALSISMVLLAFGVSEYLHCNGFIAVYICGIMLNASAFRYQRLVVKFHDALAWLMQIILFLALGLLVFPSELVGVAFKALLLSLFLMLVARPAAVWLGLWGSSFTFPERVLTAWTGLRGAVPIVLATFPLAAGYQGSDTIFNMVFFTVLTSVLIQGMMLMPVARWLKVDEPMAAQPKYSLDIEQAGQVQGETRELEVQPEMTVVGKTIADLDLPPDALILLIGRGDGFVVPRGHTRIEPYDTLVMLGRRGALQAAEDAILTARPRVRQSEPLSDPLAMLPLDTNEKFLSKQVVVVGYGRVGRRICDLLSARNVPFVVAEQDRQIVEQLRNRDIPAVVGDASTAMVLAQAHILRAAVLVITAPDTMKVRQMVEIARQLNPSIKVIIQTRSEMEANMLRREELGSLFLAEEELAKNIGAFIMERMPS